MKQLPIIHSHAPALLWVPDLGWDWVGKGSSRGGGCGRQEGRTTLPGLSPGVSCASYASALEKHLPDIVRLSVQTAPGLAAQLDGLKDPGSACVFQRK